MAITSKPCPRCNQTVEEDDRFPNLLLDPQRDKIKHPKALHICPGARPGPKSAAEVRVLVAAPSPTRDQAAHFLSTRVKELQKLGLSSVVPTQDDLIPVLAADMKRKNALKGTEAETKTDEQWTAQARQQITDN